MKPKKGRSRPGVMPPSDGKYSLPPIKAEYTMPKMPRRPGSEAFADIPSRQANSLVYRDGREEQA